MAASTAFLDYNNRVVRAYTASTDRVIGIETASYFGAVVVDGCDIKPVMRLVYGGQADYNEGGFACQTASV